MLKFFRKYQRFFFIIVTVVIVISFSFFGTFSTLASRQEIQDEVIGKAMDGSGLYRRELEELVRFLSTSIQDAPLFNRGKVANLLNDDVIRRDFLTSGLGKQIAERFFEDFRPELEERLKKIRNFVPYSHPQVPTISAETMWRQFSPEAYQLILELREKCQRVDLDFFSKLHALAERSRSFPTEMMRRLLMLQERQTGLRPDESLQAANLHPFGFETYEDWFGERYLDLISQYILNAARIAEKRGYSVSINEARRELLNNAQEGLKLIDSQMQITPVQVRGFFSHQIAQLGFEESRLVKLWQKVVLFRRLVSDVGNFALIDPLSFEAWGNFAHETADVEAYELPEHLRLRDFRSLLKLQCYLEGTMGVSSSQIQIPEKWLPIEEIEKRSPELAERRCELEWKEVKRDELAQRVTLKETWNWETQDAGWQMLQQEFPHLVRGQGDRLSILDRTSPQDRLKIDQFARLKIVESNPEWLSEALLRAPSKREKMGVRMRGGSLPLAVEPAALLAAVQKSSAFHISSKDGQTLYQVKVHEISSASERLSFQQANRDGTLDDLLDKRLEDSYPDLRKKHTTEFSLQNGGWKPLHEVSEQVGAYLFAPLLRALDESLGKKEMQPLSFYANHRLYTWMQKQHQKLLQNGDLIESADPEWKLCKEIRSVKRGEKTPFKQNELFSLPEGAWSTVSAKERGEIGFFRLLGRRHESSLSSEEMAKMKERLTQEASHKLMNDLLDTMVEKKAIGIKWRKTSS